MTKNYYKRRQVLQSAANITVSEVTVPEFERFRGTHFSMSISHVNINLLNTKTAII